MSASEVNYEMEEVLHLTGPIEKVTDITPQLHQFPIKRNTMEARGSHSFYQLPGVYLPPPRGEENPASDEMDLTIDEGVSPDSAMQPTDHPHNILDVNVLGPRIANDWQATVGTQLAPTTVEEPKVGPAEQHINDIFHQHQLSPVPLDTPAEMVHLDF